jgi:uncharacterized membrane protein YbhN (UPF0104 family)
MFGRSCPVLYNAYAGVALAGLVRPAPDRLRPMEAVFIALMALVVLLTGYVALVVLYRLFKTDNE